jgi:hypothetical protein
MKLMAKITSLRQKIRWYQQEICVGIMLIMTLLIVFPFGLFVPAKKATDALASQGWTDVTITDKRIFLLGINSCRGSDAAKFNAVGKNPQGETKTVHVCVTWPKDSAKVHVE